MTNPDPSPNPRRILILGHGRNYTKDYTRCSPINKDLWWDKEYVCVDNDIESGADIIWDLRKPWNWAPNELYDLVIDTAGIVLQPYDRKRNETTVKNEIFKVLKNGGRFYGRRMMYIKRDADLVSYKDRNEWDLEGLTSILN